METEERSRRPYSHYGSESESQTGPSLGSISQAPRACMQVISQKSKLKIQHRGVGTRQ